jgi:hypothetical protein
MSLATAMVLAGSLLALAATTPAGPARVALPGENGKIAFASNRTSGEGVNNPEGDFEIYGMRSDGSEPVNLTSNPAGDFTPDWQPLHDPN